jgi:hypothetical protein
MHLTRLMPPMRLMPLMRLIHLRIPQIQIHPSQLNFF